MKWRTPTELVGRLTARQRIAGGVAWHTTPLGGNNAVHPVNVPDCGWIIGKYVQGQASGALSVWHVTQHVNVTNRKTYKIPPLNFCGQTPHPEQDAAAANNTFAGAMGEYDSPALRTNFADANLKRFIQFTQSKPVQVIACELLNTRTITIEKVSGTALRVRRLKFVVQDYLPTDQREIFEAIATVGAGVRTWADESTALEYRDSEIDINNDDNTAGNQSNQAYVQRKMWAHDKYLLKTLTDRDLNYKDADIYAMCETEAITAEAKKNFWQAKGQLLGLGV